MLTNYLEILRNNLKKYRKEKGYTKEKLSIKAEISVDYISEIEKEYQV